MPGMKHITDIIITSLIYKLKYSDISKLNNWTELL